MGAVEPTVEDAIALAARLHRGARYPSPEGEPYVFHPLWVMLRLADPVDQTAAVLHDAVEDTEITLGDLRDAATDRRSSTRSMARFCSLHLSEPPPE